tara:strand:+ start:37107 stop:37481 length:375 start_codon:yes stop_codon:yes gene_type:complete
MKATYTLLFAMAIFTLMLPSGFNVDAGRALERQQSMDRRANQPRTVAPAPVEAATFGAGDAIYQVRRYYQRSLRDYSSAKFDWGTFTGDRLVFTLNATNGFGAFNGPQRMVAIFENGRLSRIAG